MLYQNPGRVTHLTKFRSSWREVRFAASPAVAVAMWKLHLVCSDSDGEKHVHSRRQTQTHLEERCGLSRQSVCGGVRHSSCTCHNERQFASRKGSRPFHHHPIISWDWLLMLTPFQPSVALAKFTTRKANRPFCYFPSYRMR